MFLKYRMLMRLILAGMLGCRYSNMVSIEIAAL